jgi:hypothetical protein
MMIAPRLARSLSAAQPNLTALVRIYSLSNQIRKKTLVRSLLIFLTLFSFFDITGPEEHQYVLDLELNNEINPDDVKQITTDRTITLLIAKKEEGPHWPRLLKQTGKTPQYVKADWDKWVDEDDEDAEEDEAGAMGGLDPAMMQQFQNMGGMGGGMGGGGGMPPGMMGGMGGGAGGMGGLEAMLAGMQGGMGGGGGMPGMPPGMQGFDMSQLGDMAAGMGGGGFDDDDEDDDDDDDDMPALEPTTK